VGDALPCSVEYNTDVFTAATVADVVGYFIALLKAVTSDPQARVSAYPLMSAEKRQQALDTCSGVDRGYSQTKGVHHLVESRARTSPDAVAVSHDPDGAREALTYAELNAYANRIARYLTSRGVAPGDNVALCLPRGVHQIAALLAIVKTGAAYVPLDVEYPLERLRFILGDVGARLLLTSADTRMNLAEFVDVVVLEQHAREIAEQSSDDLDVAFSPDMPLYVIHTSGSTGKPKGVVMPQRALVNLVEWQTRASNAGAGTVTLQFAPLNFDVSNQEIFSTLASGGMLQTVDENVRRENPRFLEFLKRRRVVRMFLPPVALEQLANEAAAKDVALDDLREVIVAGDKLQITDNVRAFFEKYPHARLRNQYGPTESHIVSEHELDGAASGWPLHPPIGKPIDNVQLYVLDENREPVPPKVAGEVYIGGPAVGHTCPGPASEGVNAVVSRT